MRDEEIHIGDVLKVRQWDDMAEEFGTYADGYIRIANKSIQFFPSMRRYCGQIFTVVQRYNRGIYGVGYRCEEQNGIWNYFVCSEMLEPIDERDFDFTDEELLSLLG